MELYLPIAEISVQVIPIILLGILVGMTSGIFGVGGGFLLSPLLIFLGIPAPIAVGTGANQLLATSFASVLSISKNKLVDYKIGNFMVLGGLVSSTLGAWLFAYLKKIGQIDLIIAVIYIIFLGCIGSYMFLEALQSSYGINLKSFAYKITKFRSVIKPQSSDKPKFQWDFDKINAKLPMQTLFTKSNITMSLYMPLGLGVVAGLLSALMGIGGGLIMVPAMVYLLKLPPKIVVGTSLYQIIFISANTSFWQSALSESVDMILALQLILGGLIGARWGLKIGIKLPPEKMRLILSSLILVIAAKLLYSLLITPEELYKIEIKL